MISFVGTTCGLALTCRSLQLVLSCAVLRGQNLEEGENMFSASVDRSSKEKILSTTHFHLRCCSPFPKPRDFPVKTIPIASTFKIHCILFIFKIMCFWLCWVLVATHGLSPVGVSGGHSLSRCIRAASLVAWAQVLGTHRLSSCSCSTWA